MWVCLAFNGEISSPAFVFQHERRKNMKNSMSAANLSNGLSMSGEACKKYKNQKKKLLLKEETSEYNENKLFWEENTWI